MKKPFTIIWEDRWRTGSHWNCLIKKTWVIATDIHSVMSEYGEYARFIFEGFQCTIGEHLNEETIEELP